METVLIHESYHHQSRFSLCCPVLTPHKVGTGLPPVTRKKSVLHWPLKSGGAKSKVSKSTLIWKKIGLIMSSKWHQFHANQNYLTDLIIHPVNHQVANSLRTGRILEIGGIFWSGPSTIVLNWNQKKGMILFLEQGN